jgi:ABC-type uncharacterized transport system fused permease/ATPase subunit
VEKLHLARRDDRAQMPQIEMPNCLLPAISNAGTMSPIRGPATYHGHSPPNQLVMRIHSVSSRAIIQFAPLFPLKAYLKRVLELTDLIRHLRIATQKTLPSGETPGA